MNRFWMAGATAFLILTANINVDAADFLPLAPGNTWTYRDAVTGQSFTIQVGTPVLLNQNVYYTLRGYTKDPLFVRLNAYDNLVYWDEEREQDILLISFERIRARWEAPRRECTDQGETMEARSIYEGAAGRWSVIDIHYRSFTCADAGDQLEQFTENIGMVRRVVSTIAGPRTFDLVHARIGNQIIASGNTGSFSVTTAPAPQSGFWIATLRIVYPLNGSLKLRFPSSQEYDLRLRDSDGNILWTWSADKLFLQAVHEMELNGGFTATVVVPFPPAVPEGRRVYTLEAWMTNFDGEPRFAAATTTEVPVVN